MIAGWSAEFLAWQSWAQMIEARAERVQRSIHERAWRLAASVGIGRCLCSLHNASIDVDMVGWCARNPERLRVAKIAVAILGDWSVSALGYRIRQRGYAKLARRHGMPAGLESWAKGVPLGNPRLLFASVDSLLKGGRS